MENVYPEAIRREMERMARERQTAATPPAVPPAAGSEPEGEPLPALEDLQLLPMPDDPYLAHSRPSNQPQHMLCLLQHGVGYQLLDYGNFDSAEYVAGNEPGASPVLVLRFGGLYPKHVYLIGRNLRSLGSYLRQHRIGWLREHPTGAVPATGKEMIIARILVKPLEEPEAPDGDEQG